MPTERSSTMPPLESGDSPKNERREIAPPNSLREWLKSALPKIVKLLSGHMVVALALILLAFVGANFMYTYFANRVIETTSGVLSKDRYAFCTSKDPASDGKILLPDLVTFEASVAEKHRIEDQAIKAQRLECLDAAILGRYAANYYMAVVMAVVFTGIAAIALFFVGPKGWTASNPYLVNVLVVSGTIAAFYAGFPGLFKQADMVAAYKAQFLRYEELLDGMKSQIATPSLVPRMCVSRSASADSRVHDKPFSVAEFIACNDDALAALVFPFGLEPTRGPDYSTIGKGPAGK